MRQVATFSKSHTHQALTRWDQRRVNGEVGRAARETLDIDGPLLRVEFERIEGALLGQVLDLVDILVSTVVAGSRVALRVLVGQARSLELHRVATGKIFRGNQLDAAVLASLLLQE